MYSLVLMAAMTPGQPGPAPAAAPAAPIVMGCTGCSGYSCSGFSSCHGCSGSSCHGFLGLRNRGCHGCHGGGFLGHRRSSCHGCTGWTCFGSCTGAGCCGGGCAGAVTGTSTPVGYYNPAEVYGTVTHITPIVTTPVVIEEKKTNASIKFRLPAETKLYVDGSLTNLTGAERAFVTPALGAGKFFYDVRAELVVDGQVIVEQKRVLVEAGATLVESFPVLFAAIEKKTDAAVAGK